MTYLRVLLSSLIVFASWECVHGAPTHLVLRMAWDPSRCILVTPCSRTPFKAFTIDRLYVLDNTVVNDSGQYENCYAGTQDVPSTLSPALQASLRCLWRNKTGSDEALWTNQWRKYGSCTGLTIEAYFQLAVDKFTQYDANKVIAESGLAPPAIDRDALLAATAAAAGARTWAVCDPPTKTLRASKYDTECQGQLAMPVGVAQTVDPTCTAYIPKTYEYSNDGSGSSVPPSSPSSPPPPPPQADESSSSSSVGAIVGGVIGGLAVVALAVAAFLVYRQRRRKSETVADASSGYTVQHQQQLQQNGSMHPSAYGAPAYATVPREAASAGGWTSDGHASASASDVTRSTVITDSLTPYMASIAPPAAAAAAPRGNLAAWQLPYEDITIERPAPGYTTDGVFKAVWNHTAVAVQVVTSAAVADSRDNATREVEAVAELQAGLHHPNIVQFLGYCTWPTCLVTEYVDRGSLRAVLADAAADPRRAAELTWERRMGVAWGACRALLFCHTRPAPIIHRALSSMTLLVGADWTPKLAGFEHACVMGRSGEANGAIGNPRWMSPQSIDGTAPTPADDMYSFGMVLFELLTLQLPWGDGAPWAVVTEIQAGRRPVVPPAAQLGLRPTPSGLDAYVALMQRCWAQQPQDRPSFEQIMAELRAIAPGLE